MARKQARTRTRFQQEKQQFECICSFQARCKIQPFVRNTPTSVKYKVHDVFDDDWKGKSLAGALGV